MQIFIQLAECVVIYWHHNGIASDWPYQFS